MLQNQLSRNTCSGTNKDSSQTFIGRRHGNIYLLDVNPNSTHYLISIKEDKDLWHKRLWHVSMKQISKISNKKLVQGLPNLKYKKTELCNAYTLGK